MVSFRAIICALIISIGVAARPIKPPDDNVIKSNGSHLSAVNAPHGGLQSLQLLRRGFDEDMKDAEQGMGRLTVTIKDNIAPIPAGFSAGSVHGSTTSSRYEKSGKTLAPIESAAFLQPFSGDSLSPASASVRPLQSEEEALQPMDASMDDAQAEDPILHFHKKYTRVLEPEKVPPHIASEIAQMYSIYKQKYSGVPLAGMDSDNFRGLYDNVIRDRFLEMKNIVRAMLHHSNTLQLDEIRAKYLARLQTRLQEASQALSPTSDDLLKQALRDFVEQMPQKSPEELDKLHDKIFRWYEDEETQRGERWSAHRHRLNEDFNLISRLEAEMDELLGRTTPAAHHLFRRSNLSDDSRGKRADHRDVHLQRKEAALSAAPSLLPDDRRSGFHSAVEDSGKRGNRDASLVNLSPRRWSEPEGSLKDLKSIDEVLQRVQLTRDDTGAFAIADFLRRNRPLVPTHGVSTTNQRLLAAVYRRYQALHHVRGQDLALRDRYIATEQMLYSIGRNRFRDMLPVLQHMLDHREALQLVGFRSNFLEAVHERFSHMGEQLTPTVDEIIAPAEARERNARLTRWFSNNFDDVPDDIRSRLLSRVRPMIDSPEQVLPDLHFVNHIEQDLDDLARRVEERFGRGIDVVPREFLTKRGDPSDSAGEASGSHEDADAVSEASGSLRQPPVPAHRYESIWREPGVHETMTDMGLQWFDTGAIPIAEFWRLEQPLFPLISRDRQTLEALANNYRRYQLAHPVRGKAVDMDDDEVLDHDINEASGRRKLQDIDSILSHIIQDSDRLGLDQLRVDYVRALRERFSLSSQLLTPTPEEVLDRGRRAVSSIREGPSLLDDLHSAALKTVKFWNVRMGIGKSNLERFSLDFYLLNSVERELDNLVKGADTRLATGRRFPRMSFGKRDTPNTSNRQQPQNEPRQRETIDEALERLGMNRDDPGAIPIVEFQVNNQRLLHHLHSDPQQMQRLVELYRPYQEAVPVRGANLDLENERVRWHQYLDSQGRDRFRHMRPILASMSEERGRFRFNDMQIDLLRALQDRFRWTEEQMTPTLSDLQRDLRMQTNDAFRRGLPPDVIADLGRHSLRLNMDRIGVAENHLQRFRQDLMFVNVLEAELEQVVQLAAQHGPGAGPLARRAIIPHADAEDKHSDAAKETSAALRLIDLRPRSPNSPGPEGSSRPRASRLLPMDEFLRVIGMPQDEPGSESIANYLRRGDSLLPLVRRAPTERRQLMSLYRNYQNLIPIRGRNLHLEQTNLVSNLLSDDVGRDRFRHMEPVLAYVLERRGAFGVDSVREAFLRALKERFRESLDFLTPTVSDIQRNAEQELRDIASGQVTHDNPNVAERMISDVQQRIRRTLNRRVRLMNDFSLINYLEQELEAISDHTEQVAGSGRRLLRRAEMPEESLTKRSNPSLPAANSIYMDGQAQPTDAQMHVILSPLGMNLDDAHAEPIAAYRLSESVLLQDEDIPRDLESTLRGIWLIYRQQYQPDPAYSNILPAKLMLQRLLGTDEGERFGSANRIIKLLLDHETHMQLSPLEINYLRALRARFEATHQLMRPLPSTLVARVREAIPWATPQEQQQRLHTLLGTRSARILNDQRNVLIDLKLLHTFEAELGLLLVHPVH
ncbi:uncharacterized protein UTRI_04872_B [Ustilago trichophora]|uniref:Uncharacterized protein n=1 Tax=Ustilago trichophora TaxID=86804 RepID=A0A5C3EG46_9BASI|nr:uncharacterized protein UTRI_04872_B [Ustilago trichophora]